RAKHLYRILEVASVKTNVILIDARQLAIEHLMGILNAPKYLSRLMQMLEPAFEQLIQIQVLGSYQIVSSERLAHRPCTNTTACLRVRRCKYKVASMMRNRGERLQPGRHRW